MGKWAQQRKRGSAGQGTIAPQTPPAPFLDVVAGDLVSQAHIADNYGGVCTLFRSATEFGEYSLHDQEDWDPSLDWNAFVTIVPGWYKATQTGNGTKWVGSSPFSNAQHITL